MRPELIVKGQSWKSRIYIVIYAIALLLMVKLLIGVITIKDTALEESSVNKTEIKEVR
jgi:hypothetical protein